MNRRFDRKSEVWKGTSMTVDFTKDMQPSEEGPEDSLTQAVRHGIAPRSGLAGLGLALDKLTGHVPLGIDAPTKAGRKVIAGSWALLGVLKYGALGLFFLLVGIGFCFTGMHGRIDFKLLGFGLGGLLLGAVSTRWAIHAARNLRSIARA
jgi:hypothetical protein